MSTLFLDEEWSWKNITLQTLITENNIPETLKKIIESTQCEHLLKNISDKIEDSSATVFPPPNHVFRAFTIPLSKIRVIIIGQDPYHDGNAVGLCFSVPPKKKINPSLNNIYTELEKEGYKPVKTGSLIRWLEQGCLMLNTALTVEKGNPESHLEYWYEFTEKILEYISQNTKDIAWILMGKHAADFKHCADKNGHKAFITSHPSPFSAYRPFQNYPAFIGSNLFKNVNEFLGNRKIEW